MTAALAVVLNDRQFWHRQMLVRNAALKRLFDELHTMPKAMFVNWVRAGRLRYCDLPGRERYAKRPPRGAWELLQWIAGVCMKRQQTLDDGRIVNFDSIEVPFHMLAGLCGCRSITQLSEHAMDWLIEHELVHREYRYKYTSKRKPGFRRDGTTGGSNQRACILMLGVNGAALLKHRVALQAATDALAALRRFQVANGGAYLQKLGSKGSGSLFEGTDPSTTRRAVQSARARVGEEMPASPAPSVVDVEAFRRSVPSEIRGHCLPLGYGVDEQTRRRQNRNEPDGHEGPGFAEVGDHVETPRQAAPAASGAPGEMPPASPSPASPDASGELRRRRKKRGPDYPPLELVREMLLDELKVKLGGGRALSHDPFDPPPPARFNGVKLPPRAGGAFERIAREAQKAHDALAAAPPATFLGPPRSDEERAHNEAVRERALERAEHEANDGGELEDDYPVDDFAGEPDGDDRGGGE